MRDAEYERIARDEAEARVEQIRRALGERAPDARWVNVYRHVHTLAGIAPDVDAKLAQGARRLARALTDDRGRVVPLSAQQEREARELARSLVDRMDELRG